MPTAARILFVLLTGLAFWWPAAAHAEEGVGAAMRNFGRAVRDAGKAVGQGAKEVGRQTKGPAKEVGHGFRDGAVAAGHGFRDGFGKGGKAASRPSDNGNRSAASKASKRSSPQPGPVKPAAVPKTPVHRSQRTGYHSLRLC
jgi:hypothetical protein